MPTVFSCAQLRVHLQSRPFFPSTTNLLPCKCMHKGVPDFHVPLELTLFQFDIMDSPEEQGVRAGVLPDRRTITYVLA